MFGILPMYWIVSFIFVLLMIVLKKETLAKTIALAPIEIVGLQSVFSTLFGVSHNGGSWFISCILICYAVYPFLQEMIKAVSFCARKLILVVCMFILLYSPFVVYMFELESIYSNPFFRLLEFIIGMLLAAIKLDCYDNRFVKKFIYNWRTIAVVNLLMVIGVTIAVKLNIAVGNYMLYSWICLPCFMIMLLGLSGIESRVLQQSKVLKWMSEISYVFFLAQFFSNRIGKKIIAFGEIESNIVKILIGWGVCIVIALGMRFVEVWINRYLHKKTPD